MKKILILIIGIFISVSLSGCSNMNERSLIKLLNEFNEEHIDEKCILINATSTLIIGPKMPNSQNRLVNIEVQIDTVDLYFSMNSNINTSEFPDIVIEARDEKLFKYTITRNSTSEEEISDKDVSDGFEEETSEYVEEIYVPDYGKATKENGDIFVIVVTKEDMQEKDKEKYDEFKDIFDLIDVDLITFKYEFTRNRLTFTIETSVNKDETTTEKTDFLDVINEIYGIKNVDDSWVVTQTIGFPQSITRYEID